MPSPETAAAPRPNAWLRAAALLLAVAAVGLPVNTLGAYAVLVAAAVVIFTGRVTNSPARWLAAAAAVLSAFLGHAALDPPRIEEGHNVFLADGDRAPLLRHLPPDVHAFLAAEFDRLYPPLRRCDPNLPGCWRGQGFPDRGFAFSADGIWDRAAYSRRVGGIDFRRGVDLRLGFSNDVRYNWLPVNSDILRLSRDGRAWQGHDRWRLLMPFYVAYEFPPAFAGGRLCWTGTLLWEGSDRRFAALRHAGEACRTLSPEDAGRKIFGVAVAPHALSMRLDPPSGVRLRQVLDAGLAGSAALAVVVLLAGLPTRRTLLPALLIGLSLAATVIDDAAFLGGFRPHDGGDDGLFYEGTGRVILGHLLGGDFMAALRGGEPVFYYGGPGLRYLRALERLVFGDTNLGYLSLVLLLPVLVFAVFRRFLSPRWALALALLFVATPLGALFGSSFFQYLTNAARGYADPAAYILFLGGLLAVTHRVPRDRLLPAFGGALLLALAVFVRPNIAPLTGILIGGAGMAALWRYQLRRLAGLCAGFSLVLFMPWHNWYFGGVFVLFSSNAAHPQLLLMPPAAWLAALAELARLDFAGAHVARMLAHLAGWLGGLVESPLLIPLHAAAVAVVVHVVARGRGHDPWLRLLAGATLAQHAVALFYIHTPRYYLLTWLMTFLVVAAWARRDGFPWIARAAPDRSARLMRSAVMVRTGVALTWLQRRLGVAGAPPP